MLIGGLYTCRHALFLSCSEEEGPVLSIIRYSGNFNHFFDVQPPEEDTNLVRNGYRR